MKTKHRRTFNPSPNINELMTISTLRHYAKVFEQSANFLEATLKIGNGVTVGTPVARSGTRVLSIAARRKIAKAQKNRWAKNKTGTTGANVTTMGKGKSAASAA